MRTERNTAAVSIALGFLGLLLTFSCKDPDEKGAGPEVRTDGIYVAHDTYAWVGDTTGINKSLKSMNVLRFNDDSSAVLVTSHIDKSITYNDTIVKHLDERITVFQQDNPGEKDFVNFRYKTSGDSVWFQQSNESVTIKYSGKMIGDSLIVNRVIIPPQHISAAGPSPAQQLRFKFYEAK